MSTTTVLVALVPFTAGGVAYKAGDIIADDHHRVWPAESLTNRLNNGFAQYQPIEDVKPTALPVSNEEDKTLGGMQAKGGKAFEPVEDTPDGGPGRGRRVAELRAMNPKALKAAADKAGVPYTNKNETIAAIIAKEPAPSVVGAPHLVEVPGLVVARGDQAPHLPGPGDPGFVPPRP